MVCIVKCRNVGKNAINRMFMDVLAMTNCTGKTSDLKNDEARCCQHGAVTCCHVLHAWGCICLGVNLCFFVPSPCSLHLGTSVFLKAKSLCFFKFLSLLGLCLLSFLIGSNAAATDAVGLFSPSSQVIGFVEPKPLVSEQTLQ